MYNLSINNCNVMHYNYSGFFFYFIVQIHLPDRKESVHEQICLFEFNMQCFYAIADSE